MTMALRAGCVAIVSIVGAHRVAAEPAIKKPSAKEALDHLAQGNKLYNVRSFAEAAEEYKAGALIEPAPIFDYNLGQCYRKMKKYEDAVWHYERFIKTSPQTTEHIATVQKLIAEMRAELDAEPPPPGPPVQPTEPQAATPKSMAPAPSSIPAPPSSVIERRPPAAPWYADTVGWTLTASGLAAVALGSGFLLNARSLDDDANAPRSQSDGKQLRDQADTRRVVGAIVGVGGVALLATGAVRLALHPTRDGSSDELSLGISAHGLALLGRF